MVWDYTDKVKELFMNAIEGKSSHIGEHENPAGKGFHGSLVCGDAISLTFTVDENKTDPTQDKINSIKYKTFGCTSAIASSEALAIIVETQKLTPIEASKIAKDDIIEFLNGLPTQKIHCSIMGIEALQNAIEDWAKKRNVNLEDFGISFHKTAEHSDSPEDLEVVCECNGLTRGYLKEQIINFNIKTLDELMDKTGAGTVCGSCIERPGGLKDILMEMNKKPENKGGEEMEQTTKSEYQIAKEIEEVLNNEIAPMLGYDNGGIEIIDIKNKTLYFRLEGACSTCSVSDYTVSAIRETLQQKIDPEIEVQRVW